MAKKKSKKDSGKKEKKKKEKKGILGKLKVIKKKAGKKKEEKKVEPKVDVKEVVSGELKKVVEKPNYGINKTKDVFDDFDDDVSYDEEVSTKSAKELFR